MKQIKSILINTICIVSLFGLMSCIKEIDLESLRPDPTLVVDNCYYEMRRYRNLVSYYTNKNIAVSYLRARKKNDMERVMRLYGNETSKYW